MVYIVEERLQVFYFLFVVGWVDAQDADELEEVEQYGSGHGQEVGCWVWTRALCWFGVELLDAGLG